MIPNTLSATSIQVAKLCMRRWEAEYLDKTPGFQNAAANIGTTCHGALEKFVQMCLIDKQAEPTWSLLKDLYTISYLQTFGSADTDTPEFKDGLSLTQRWFKRTTLTGFEVESVEVKENFPIPYIDPISGEKMYVLFNYVMDRVDKTGENEYRIVDYKSQRAPIQPNDLVTKVQARAYALALQIKHPNATRIQVIMDLLRHDIVGMVFTRDDNIATWEYLKAETQRIVDTPSGTRPTLNMECGYCAVKATCQELTRNIDGGGIHSLPIEEVAALKEMLDSQVKGQKWLLEELDERLLKEAYNLDVLEYPAGEYDIEVKAQRRRKLHPPTIAKIIGPDLFSQLGNINLGTIDDLIKSDEITDDQKELIKAEIYFGTGEPHAQVKRRGA